MPCERQVHLRGQADFLHKLQAASHIYDTWTDKGADTAALADRILDGSVDKLDEYMTAANEPAKVIPRTHVTAVPSVSLQTKQNRTAEQLHQAAVPVLQKDSLSYVQFVQDFMQPNLPVMIQGLSDEWQATQDWVTPTGDVNIDFLAAHFGQAQVWVSDTTRVNAACAPRLDMTVAEFADWWRMHKAGKDSRLLYLKDWHFANQFPAYTAYETPRYFHQDWLNDFYDMKQAAQRQQQQNHGRPAGKSAAATQHGGCTDDSSGRSATGDQSEQSADSCCPRECEDDNQCDIVSSDYRFVYLGCKGTWTALHADVLRSYSWSTNVTGRKRWKLLPPQFTHLLYDRFGRDMAATFDLAKSEGRERFPNLDQACQHVVECLQEAGDTVFVPSGWHHTVHNLEDTLSINHNWLNAYNIHWAWALLKQEHSDATAAIEDCREGCSPEEFEGLVQRNMAANCGMNYAFMAEFMRTILDRETCRLGGCDMDTQGHNRLAFSAANAGGVLHELHQQLGS